MTDWSPDTLVAEARAVDGLTDFGDDAYREPLEKLAWSLEHEAQLNETGDAVLRQRVVDVLANQLRIQAWMTRHPEILDEEISAPLVVVGLPRTGTTMLHRTIAADPRICAPLWYETRFPCPALDWDPAGVDARIVDAKAEVAAMIEANPDILAVHPMDAMGPDEDIMLLEQSFYSYTIQAFAHVPGFDAWLEAQDHRVGYAYLKKLLQFLQWQRKQVHAARGEPWKAERWALKAPHHLHFMDLVFETFPEAKVVQTHRDPVETIPSLASMTRELWVIYSDEVDPVEAGRTWARKFARGMNHTMDVRERMGDERFLDLWFTDTVSRPLDEIRRIYDFIGMDLTDEARQEMNAWLDFNRRELRPAHAYTLDEFGFTEAGLKARFERYRNRFIEPSRPR
jgi:hypothetical protein